MIARVRIAPVEQWCDWYTRHITKKNMHIVSRLVGGEIEIITESMMPAVCDPEARMWKITDRTLNWLEDMKAQPSNFGAICEHLLEMD